MNQSEIKSHKVSFIAGVCSGVICTIICSPIDVAKIRFQVQGSLGIQKYSGGAMKTIRSIYLDEGFRGLFRGLAPALLTLPIFLGIYWPIYETMKSHSDSFPNFIRGNLFFVHTISAITGEGISNIVTNPLWVIRTRIQTFHLKETGPTPTVLSTSKRLYHEEGVAAFSKGISASMLGLAFPAIQFPIYEAIKAHLSQYPVSLISKSIVASILSTAISSCITYPHEVLRSRIQNRKVPINDPNIRGVGLMTIAKDMVTKEGIKAFWAGFQVNLMRIIPATCTTFVSYEYISQFLTSS